MLKSKIFPTNRIVKLECLPFLMILSLLLNYSFKLLLMQEQTTINRYLYA